MKIPADAIVEWRCSKCLKPFGYLRQVNGHPCITTMRERLSAGPDGGSLLVLDADRPLSNEDRNLIEASGYQVRCGRHRATLGAADIRPAGIRRRKVMLTPWSATLVRNQPSYTYTETPPLPAVRRSQSLD